MKLFRNGTKYAIGATATIAVFNTSLRQKVHSGRNPWYFFSFFSFSLCIIRYITDEGKIQYVPSDIKLYLTSPSRTKTSRLFKHDVDSVLVKQAASCEEMLSYEEFFGRRMAFRITGLIQGEDFTAVSIMTWHLWCWCNNYQQIKV